MITKQFFEEISSIDENLKNYFSSLNQTDLENILSRLAKMTEEVGELNSDVLKKYYKRKIATEDNLELEFADVIITLALLAKSLDIDLNTAIIKKFNIIKQRWWI